MYKNATECFNNIVTEIKAYEEYNSTSDMYAVMHGFRGLGRFHNEMYKRATKDFEMTRKVLGDKPFGIATEVDFMKVGAISKAGMFKKPEMLQHVKMWYNHLDGMKKTFIDSAYWLSENKHTTAYGMLLEHVKQIENEMWAIGVLVDRVEPDVYQHPDIKEVLKNLHVYFEKHYDGKMIDFDI